jgi:o-succinylbenzoate synthase
LLRSVLGLQAGKGQVYEIPFDLVLCFVRWVIFQFPQKCMPESTVKIRIIEKPFKFAFPVGTSRGTLLAKTAWFIVLEGATSKKALALGEGAPLPGLSLEGTQEWRTFSNAVEGRTFAAPEDGKWRQFADYVFRKVQVNSFSSGVFALECCAAAYETQTPFLYFDSPFAQSNAPIEINGLVWMNAPAKMLAQAAEKAKAGFTTIKFKIGTQDWPSELALLRSFRNQFGKDEYTLRVDANGAYKPGQVEYVLDDLATLGIHSIEQPIAAGQFNAMATLVKNSPVPIALDEELISLAPVAELHDQIRYMNPAFVVLKPTLQGGLGQAEDFINLTKAMPATGWWLTSSLETTVGLTALAQFTASFPQTIPHGLSTGNIYQKSLPAPIALEGANLYCTGQWPANYNALIHQLAQSDLEE